MRGLLPFFDHRVLSVSEIVFLVGASVLLPARKDPWVRVAMCGLGPRCRRL
jgi:hypothetical protein